MRDAVVNWGHDQWVPLATFHFYDRNYEVFGELNGVRRSIREYGPPDAEGWSSKLSEETIDEPLIVEPRGLPSDASWVTKQQADKGHVWKPTWLTLEECERVDANIKRLHGADSPVGPTWLAILAAMKACGLASRLIFWTDQA